MLYAQEKKKNQKPLLSVLLWWSMSSNFSQKTKQPISFFEEAALSTSEKY